MSHPPYPTTLPHTITRADIGGAEHRITLLGGGHYRIDDAQQSQSSMIGDGQTIKLASSDTDPLTTITFPNGGDWKAQNLGYENLWMLIRYYPLDRTPGLSGYPCRGAAGQR